jgi:hypothetical protein
MEAEAAAAGFYESPWGTHPRLQILTIAELLEGEKYRLSPGTAGKSDFQEGSGSKGENGRNRALAFHGD